VTLSVTPITPALPTPPAPIGRGALRRAVVTALHQLDSTDPAGPADSGDRRRRWDRCRDLATTLRRSLERHGGAEPRDAVPAITVACAYLAAGDAEEAFAALLVAHDKLR
jgi:thioredoxin-like negative regulator of GroEL